jgi:hypothetical protein
MSNEPTGSAATASRAPEFGAGWDACIVPLGRSAAQDGIKALMARGFHKPGDVENRLGYYLGQLARQAARDASRGRTARQCRISAAYDTVPRESLWTVDAAALSR